jgi:hypothetical protein
MARLPTPGSDNDVWGNLLNDFLSVEMNTNGALKLRTDGTLNNLAHTTGDESVTGVKTFNSSPVVPMPTLGSQAANKTYVDSVTGGGAVGSIVNGDGTIAVTNGTGPIVTVAANVGMAAGTVAAGNDARFSSIAATTQSGSYTFALGDAGTCVEGTSASAQTFTIPPHASVALAVGTIMEVFQFGSGQITIATGAGVTILSDGGRVNTAAQYATISLRQRATNVWVLAGDLV